MNQVKTEHSTYRETRWHLLRLDKNGGLRPFAHFRRLVMIVAGLILVMAGAIGWLLMEWLDTKGKLVVIQERVSRQNRALKTIHHEKESALARLAITESKLKAAVSSPPMEKQDEPPAVIEGEKTAVNAKPESGQATEAPVEKMPSPATKASDIPETSDDAGVDTVIEKVTADNLFVCALPNETSLNIEFKVINMGTRKEPVSGHVFILLKDAHAEQDQWLVVPSAMLMDGRPVQSRGQQFRIYNYRTIKFKVAHENPGVFVQASIFIFKNTGELIFEREFTLEPIQTCP